MEGAVEVGLQVVDGLYAHTEADRPIGEPNVHERLAGRWRWVKPWQLDQAPPHPDSRRGEHPVAFTNRVAAAMSPFSSKLTIPEKPG